MIKGKGSMITFIVTTEGTVSNTRQQADGCRVIAVYPLFEPMMSSNPIRYDAKGRLMIYENNMLKPLTMQRSLRENALR